MANSTDDDRMSDNRTRRNVLRVAGALGTSALAGCGLFGSGSDSTPSGAGTKTPTDGPAPSRGELQTEEFTDYQEPDREMWAKTAGRSVTTSPVVTDEAVLVGSDATVFAFDRQRGDQRWRYPTAASEFIYDLTVVDSVAYVGTSDGVIEAFDIRDRTQVWQQSLAAGRSVNSLAIDDGRLFAGTSRLVQGDGRARLAGRCLSHSVSDGTRQWEAEISGGLQDADVLVDDGTVYVGGTELAAFAPSTGERRWSVDLGDDEVQGIASDEATLYARTESAVEARNKTDGALGWQSGDAITNCGPPTVADGTLYTVTAESVMGAVSTAAGEEAWTTELGRTPATNVAITEETAYVGADDLWALNRTDGRKQWRFDLQGPARGLALTDGVLYVGDGAGNATAIET